jgi:hypothetical protein
MYIVLKTDTPRFPLYRYCIFCRFGYCTVMATTYHPWMSNNYAAILVPGKNNVVLMRPTCQSSDVSIQATLRRRHRIFLWMCNFIVIIHNKGFSKYALYYYRAKIIELLFMYILADARHAVFNQVLGKFVESLKFTEHQINIIFQDLKII